MNKEAIVLIGMPGSGKSTIGRLLAKKLNFKFIDGDECIEEKEKMTLQEIIDAKGDKGFCRIEQKRILELLPITKHILAPGGSIVYSKKLMNNIKECCSIVFLDICFEIIQERLTGKLKRGIVGLKSKSLKQLHTERQPLYEKYADITIDCNEKPDQKVINEIISGLMI